MTNYLNEKRNYAVVFAALLCTLIVTICGLTTGIVYAVRYRHAASDGNDNQTAQAQYLLSDAAENLVHSMSALRLCNETEPAETINRTALVHAVRAEMALEFHNDDFADSRTREAFLNDMAIVLHSYETEQTMEIADMLYDYSTKFYESISSENGYGEFDYNGELIKGGSFEPDDGHDTEITDEDKASGAELVKTALNTTREEYVGDWDGHIEYYIERNGVTGYAMVCNDKIIEFSFMRGEAEETDIETAKEVALATAEACGYGDLSVKWCENTGKSVSVVLCKTYDGAFACDDYATAVIYSGETVAFTASNCEREHKDIPSPKINEIDARHAAKQSQSNGVLVVRTINGKERICYEYRYELEDGVHFVYVCAENGKQIEVR